MKLIAKILDFASMIGIILLACYGAAVLWVPHLQYMSDHGTPLWVPLGLLLFTVAAIIVTGVYHQSKSW